MQAEPCQQWPKGLCRRHETCKFYHAPLQIPPLRLGQCSWLKNGAKRCESNATYNENGKPLCFDHTESGRHAQTTSGEKRSLLAPERVAKRVSGKSRMVNPYEVGYLVGGAKKDSFDKVDPSSFLDCSRPLIVDVGSAQGRFLIQLAQRHSELATSSFNYVGFELRSGLVNAANEAVKSSSINGSVIFLQGDAKTNMLQSLAPVVAVVPPTSTGGSDASFSSEVAPSAHVEWLTIQFPDPWTKKKHHKRRLVDPTFVAECATLMTHPQGKVYICSDRYDLALFMYDTFAASELWRPLSEYVNSSESATTDNSAVIAATSATSIDKDEEEEEVEEEEAEEELAFGADVYREKDLNDARLWLPRRPFPVGTERDSVAEKKNRPVHRAIFVRAFTTTSAYALLRPKLPLRVHARNKVLIGGVNVGRLY